ncbi:MAG TPA: alpha/beta fold hydrolase [Bryobacteraceae bacterium]|jgi:pimeloyl-ACP methyl ester carboxylesterase|nr:alpha/beta fold hydrolase [Bryobacteraceae bacterium]
MPALPFVLAHGYLGFSSLGPLHYFNKVQSILQSAGATVFAPTVSPKQCLAERSAQLAAAINSQYKDQKVHVIAHSMGGLDARTLIQQNNPNIATLTTLGTPFRGTLAADIAANPRELLTLSPTGLLRAVAHYQAQQLTSGLFTSLHEVSFAVQQLTTALQNLQTGDYSQLTPYFQGLFSLDDAALAELTTASCRQKFPDDESDLHGIPSYSFAGSIAPALVSPPLTVPAILLAAAALENDGIVPLASAKLHNHQQTLTLDHFGLVGWSSTDITALYRHIYSLLIS